MANGHRSGIFAKRPIRLRMNSGVEILMAKVLLDQIRSDELPLAAADALEAGLDSPSLRMLAGLTSDESHREAFVLFERALNELDLQKPTKNQAVLILAREIARNILDKSVGVYEGAKHIYDLQSLGSYTANDDNLDVLDQFIYCDCEWESREGEAGTFDAEIIEAAKELVK